MMLFTKGTPTSRAFISFRPAAIGAAARGRTSKTAAEISSIRRWQRTTTCSSSDINGSQPDRRKPRATRRQAGDHKDGSPTLTWDAPPADLVANTKTLLRQGKPMIFLHHASASWAHSWPEFTEVMGIACDWGQPLRVRGLDHPKSGYFQKTQQNITVVDKAHPITQGLGDSFQIVDEAYNCPIFEDSVHPLLRTDFAPKDVAANLNPRAKFSNLAAWVKTAENGPCYISSATIGWHGKIRRSERCSITPSVGGVAGSNGLAKRTPREFLRISRDEDWESVVAIKAERPKVAKHRSRGWGPATN